MTNEIITKTKWFWAWQDEKEEVWLSEMANQGLHLENIQLPGNYQFRKGDPANYVYRLDYQSLKSKDKDSYLQLFSDAGWKLVGEMGGWVYFRYKVLNGETPEIYSDPESKIGKYQRVMTYLAIFLPLMIIVLPNISTTERYGPFFVILEGLSALIMVLFAYGMIQLFRRINQLKRKD